MTLCTQCGAHTPETVTRGPLTVQIDPPQVFWRGKPFHVTPRQCKLLHFLAAHGEASHLAARFLAAGENTAQNTVTVQITFLRRRLPQGVRIEAVDGWGYKLRIDHEG
jgi:DNA-binding response OmpR family regulator